MVQKSRIGLVIWYILLRIFFLCLLVWVAGELYSPTLDLLKNNLGYHTPNSFLDVFINWAAAWDLDSVFLACIFFGILGGRIDYFIITIFIILGFWDFHGIETVNIQMYLGLFGAAVLGNAIGFGLKLLRKKFLPKLKV